MPFKTIGRLISFMSHQFTQLW